MSNDSYCDPNLPFRQYIAFVFLETLSGLSALIGNSIVLFSIATTPGLQTISNFFIVSLALADLCAGLVISPLYIALTTTREWVNSSHPLYRAENFLWVQTLVATTLSLCAVSIDRYVAVTSVFHYEQTMTKSKCSVIIGTVWVISFIFASTSVMITTTEQASILWVSCVIFTVILPGFVIAYCYYHIFKAARRQVRLIRTATNTHNTTEALRNRKTAVTIGIVTGFFVIMFTPNFIFSLVELATKDSCEKMLVYRYWLWANFVVFANSACNPWIYALRMKEFKKAFRRILIRKSNTVKPKLTVSLRSYITEKSK